ncbi:MAG: hypothetical protein K2J10_02545 [Muribaculaceae bacterium]|nr:hypothetical protein [Muribaculaceae bacterium]
MKLVVKLAIIVFLFSALICRAKSPSITVTWDKLDENDTIIINGRIYAALGNEYFHFRDNICMSYPKLNEGRVSKELENSLIRGYIYPEPYISEWVRPVLPKAKNLEALPYFISMYCDNRYSLPEYIRSCYGHYLYDLCTQYIQDEQLYKLGQKMALRHKLGYSHEKWNPMPGYIQEKAMIDGSIYGVDSLRVRAIAHNDREALSKLEKYYQNIGNDKGIAIYYKVMLGYRDNGDLAERFFKVLEPYLSKTPEYRAVIKDVLIRAALCDKNERAAALCDSLGFSFCDYRLPQLE